MTFENVLPNAISIGKTDLHSIYRCSSYVHAHWSIAIYQYGELECLWNDSHAISALINLNEQLICYSSRLISKSHSHRPFSGVVQLWMVKKHRPTLLCSVWKGKSRTIQCWMFYEIDCLTSSYLHYIFFFFCTLQLCKLLSSCLDFGLI